MLAHSVFFRKNLTTRFFSDLSKKKIGDLYLIRHAKSDHNVHNCCAGYDNRSQPTADGIEDTRKAGQVLSARGIQLDALYVSPLNRALITAQVLVSDLPRVTMIPHKALAERNFGAFTGMSKSKIKEILTPDLFYRYIHDKHFYPPPIGPGHTFFQSNVLYGVSPDNHKGESYACVIQRLRPFVDRIQEALQDGKNIGIVGHSHNLQILQMLLHGTSFEEGIEQYKIDHVTPMKFTFSCNASNQLKVEERINLIEEAQSPLHQFLN